jgi:hypothetical protein
MRITSLRALFFFMMFSVASIWAQTGSVSPYSRFGLGDLQFNGYFINQHMGGMGTALRDSLRINPLNPASYNALRLTTSELGIIHNQMYLSTTKLSETNNATYLSHLAIAFPMGNKMGLSIGIHPFSSLGYDIVSYEEKDSIGTMRYIYQGKGGVNAFKLGYSIEVLKGLSFGLNSTFYFGNSDRVSSVEFDSLDYFNTRVTKNARMGNFYFLLGGQYAIDLRADRFINLGATYGLSRDFEVEYDYSVITYEYTSQGTVVVKDSIISRQDQLTKIALPTEFSLGVSTGKKNSWMVGGDYHWRNWASFVDQELGDSLVDGFRFSLGGSWIPDFYSPTGYFKKTQYRFGAFYEKSPLNVNGNDIYNYGMSFGLGLPFYSKTLSTMNVGVQLGQRGTLENDLIRERYIRVSLGVTFNEKWFVRRKID